MNRAQAGDTLPELPATILLREIVPVPKPIPGQCSPAGRHDRRGTSLAPGRTTVRGALRDRTFESQFYRASGLNLLINAIVYWNTLYLEPAFVELNQEGVATPPDVIKHIAPLGWQHISLTGDYIWTPTDSLDLRPLRCEASMLAA
jgi:hypothetical protein